MIGFHGQTVLHRPEQRLTVQIGDGASLAKAAKIPVVYDLRAADVAAGGQGAPLVPVFHRALARVLDGDGPTCFVNIGGVANITYMEGDKPLVACDTGPGNALLDDFMLKTTGQAVDRDGALAATGQVDEAWVQQTLRLPFFDQPPPKSLDRNDFASTILPEFSARRRRGNADGADRSLDRPRRAAAAETADCLGRRRWRRQQPDLDANAARAAGAGEGRDGRGARLAWRCHRGAGVCLSGDPQPEGVAADLSANHRRAGTHDRGRSRETVNFMHLHGD